MRWLTWMGAVCVASGCMLPQDDIFLEELPERRNRPPRIVETQVQPPVRIIRDFGAAGQCELEFSVIVEDPDVDDRISVKWYLDYNPQNPIGPYRETDLARNGQSQRGERATLNINLRAANSPLRELGTHLVEALVTDSRLLAGRQPESITYEGDGGVIVNPGFVVTYSWFVTTVQGDCT
ncbi:hypothetical protein [Stigmatella aurantiaca]|uniref:Conserved uncharacterized protein n=2 Tax=Stigmatella aurantiaca (strain DW4/3-1) TaxID=378806 RepID=E3FVQ2_STIAD|nr:hypothetical protein [Stigmatella aurantiaca]ADO72266.1 conserved uncharacterized protein [Stigmatella aurantiaca DW4/3-1]